MMLNIHRRMQYRECLNGINTLQNDKIIDYSSVEKKKKLAANKMNVTQERKFVTSIFSFFLNDFKKYKHTFNLVFKNWDNVVKN